MATEARGRERDFAESLKSCFPIPPGSAMPQPNRVGEGNQSSVFIASFHAIKGGRSRHCVFLTERRVCNVPAADVIRDRYLYDYHPVTFRTLTDNCNRKIRLARCTPVTIVPVDRFAARLTRLIPQCRETTALRVCSRLFRSDSPGRS